MNMQISDISPWGVVLAVLLMGGVLGLFSLYDRRVMNRMLRVLAAVALSLAVVSMLMWGVLLLNTWWAYVVWALLLAVCVSLYTLNKARLSPRPFLLPLFGSVLVGMGIVYGTMLLLTGMSYGVLMLGVLSVASGMLMASACKALAVYIASMRHTQEHYQYMLANGASHEEAVLPSVIRAMRATVVPTIHIVKSPLLLAPPLVFCGMLLGGIPPLVAALLVFILIVLVQVACVVTTFLTILLVDRSLFDDAGRFVYL